MNIDYVQLYNALLMIQKVCRDTSGCYSCPLADTDHRCRVTGQRITVETYTIKPSNWKIADSIHMFIDSPKEAKNCGQID